MTQLLMLHSVSHASVFVLRSQLVRQATTHTHVDGALFSCHDVLPHIDTTYVHYVHETFNIPNITGILGVNINRPV